ncbi:MAG: hypothetical protein B6229_00105 [Spirochaetaceae bacterium 4572_7]|nr:MAG: hypothetical protein B6229_00105 [Spirochaetaceae bacterium 4572_7]
MVNRLKENDYFIYTCYFYIKYAIYNTMLKYTIESMSDSHFHILEMQKKNIDTALFFSNWETYGGKYLVDIGIDEDHLEKRLECSKDRDYLYHSVGIHPNNASGNLKSRILTIENQLKNKRVIAIGETGLDYYWDTTPKKLQKEFFISHIDLAIKYNLPIIIHNRDASEDILEILKSYNGKIKGVIHCFSSTPYFAKEFIKLGFYISFAGNLTYKNSSEIQESLKIVSIDKLLIETDSPYLAPQKVRGQINSPLNIGYTLDYMSDQLHNSRANLIGQIHKNLIELFGFKEEI